MWLNVPEIERAESIDELITDFEKEIQIHFSHDKEFAKRASEIGHPSVAKFFRAIRAAEAARSRLYHADLNTHRSLAKTMDYFVCPVCGYAQLGEPPETCPLCNTQGGQFEKID